MLAVALLVHPAITLGRVRPGAPLRRGLAWSVGIGVGGLVATFVGGWVLYPGWRSADKRVFLAEAPLAARLFETKEHLAYYALACALGAGLALFGPRTAAGLRLARRGFGLAAALAGVAAAHGLVVHAFSR